MKKNFLVLIGFLFLSAILYGQTKIVITASELAPLCSPSMSDNGLLPQIMSEALKGKKYTINYEFQPFARVVANIANKSINIAFISSFLADKTNYHIKQILLSNVVLFYKKTKFPKGLQYKDLSELRKYTIGIVRGAPTIEMFEKAGLKLDFATDEDSDFKKLLQDRIDLVSTVDIFGWYALQNIGANIKDYSVSEPIMLIDSAIIVSKSLPNANRIISDITDGLAAMKKNEKFLQILEKYFGKGRVPSYIFPE